VVRAAAVLATPNLAVRHQFGASIADCSGCYVWCLDEAPIVVRACACVRAACVRACVRAIR
jgi:hypothetical protein